MNKSGLKMNHEVETTCGENMSLQNLLKSVAKRYYARVKKERRALSLKNVIISCVDLTLSSPQKFSHYYLQYLVLGPSYVMTTFFLILGISSNHNFRSFVNKVCLLLILLLLCFTENAKCDQDIVQDNFSRQKIENLSDKLFNASLISNVKQNLFNLDL